MNRRRFLSLLGGGAAGSLIGIPAALPAASAPAYGQIIIGEGSMTIKLPGGGIMRSKLAAGAILTKKIIATNLTEISADIGSATITDPSC